MKFSAWYAMIVGALMMMQWIFFLAAGQVPELQTEPISILFHLVGEFATALTLIISGIALLRKRSWSKTANLVALGMLIYTVMVSPGYFAQQGVWVFVIMFAVLFVFSIVSIWQLSQTKI